MLVVNHRDTDGTETIEEFLFVKYYPKGHTLDADEDGVKQIIMEELVIGYTDTIGVNSKFTRGSVFVMNESGKTVASYFLEN